MNKLSKDEDSFLFNLKQFIYSQLELQDRNNKVRVDPVEDQKSEWKPNNSIDAKFEE